MRVPEWIKGNNFPFSNYEEIPANIFDSINEKLAHIQSPNPTVSIIIAAYNEEVNIVRCLSSLASMQTMQVCQ